MSKDDILMATDQLQQSFRSKLFNNKEFWVYCGMNFFIQNETILPCHGEYSPLTDSEPGCILSGDLRIVCDKKFRKLKAKAPKCKELTSIYWDKVKSSVIDGINGTV